MAEVTLRAVRPEDCRRLWEWRNDPVTRGASFHSGWIPFEQHERWFNSRLSSSEDRIFVVLDPAGKEVGYVRFKLVGQDAEVSVALDPRRRGQGYGPAAIQAASNLLLSSGPIHRVIARVKCSNGASRKAFERAGFVRTGVTVAGKDESLEMVYAG